MWVAPALSSLSGCRDTSLGPWPRHELGSGLGELAAAKENARHQVEAIESEVEASAARKIRKCIPLPHPPTSTMGCGSNRVADTVFVPEQALTSSLSDVKG